jgi:hypothetical protein
LARRVGRRSWDVIVEPRTARRCAADLAFEIPRAVSDMFDHPKWPGNAAVYRYRARPT